MNTPQIIGSQITYLESVDSTNNYAIGSADKAVFQDGSIVVAKEQYAGKGLDKNSWESEKGKNLTFSIVLYPEFLHPARQFMLNKAISLGLADYLKDKLPAEKVFIKWPNDMYIHEGKVAGMLINNTIMGHVFTRTVIGIGLNLNQKKFYSGAPNPVSLTHCTGKEHDPENSLKELIPFLNNRYNQLQKHQQDKLDADYLSLLYRLNVMSDFITKNERFKGKITGVSEYGQLIITTQNGKSKSYDFKEVKFT